MVNKSETREEAQVVRSCLALEFKEERTMIESKGKQSVSGTKTSRLVPAK